MTKHSCLSRFSFSELGLPCLRFFFWHFSFPLGLGLIFTFPSDAQVVNYGRSPSLNVLTNPDSELSSYTFSQSNGFTCPSPSFSIGAFGGSGNDWSNDFTANYSSGSGINNFGIAVGVKVPFGGGLSRYCKDYAKSLAENERIKMDAARRNEQLTLLRQCYWLVENKINLDQDIFKSGALSSFQACTVYDFKPIQGGDNIPKSPSLDKPPLSVIPPIPSSNIILQQQR
jgi:hypothetical protein